MSDFEQAEHIRRDLPASNQIIDAQAADADKTPGLLDKLFGKKLAPAPAIVTNEQTTADVPKLKTNPLPGRADFELAASIMPGLAAYRACQKCGDIVPLTQKNCAVCGQEMSDITKWKEQPQENPPAGDAPFPGPKE
jgi:hypothetical protein